MVSVATLQEAFTIRLPWMRKTARLAFPNLDSEKREEAVSNTIALAWKAWHRLNERGRAEEPGILKAVVWYSIKQTKSGRRIDRAGKPRDVLSLRAYGKVKFEPFDLEDYVGKHDQVVDVASFHIDVPAFLRTLNRRQRTMVVDLAGGMTTTDAAKKYGLSPGRISQCRREFVSLYRQFFEE